MSWPAASTRPLFLLLCLSLVSSEVRKLTITPDQGTSLYISCAPFSGPGCNVCTGSGRTRLCQTSQQFTNSAPVSVELECLKCQGAFNVEVTRTIECTTKSCISDIKTGSNFDPLLNLNRKFIWNLKAAFPKAARINFDRTGLRQIHPSERCPDKHTYTFEVIQDTSTDIVGRFCRTGTVTNAQALKWSRFSLELPAGQKLQNINFDVSIGQEIQSLAKISLSLQQGLSSVELLSPNYPDTLPDEKLMEWYFSVPAKHQASIHFLNLTQPQCLNKKVTVEYHPLARTTQAVGLTDDQPVQKEGAFSMTLRNCKMDKSQAGSPGLTLNFKVSTSRITPPVPCEVSLKKIPGLSLYIKKLNPSSNCIMKLKSRQQDQITLLSGSVSQLYFEACLPKDLQITATKNLECKDEATTCQKLFLTIPSLPSCLPAPLSNMTWRFTLSPHGTVVLGSPSAPLKQELPGDPCNDRISIKMVEKDGTTIGNFCRNGTINKVQIHSNVSISVCGTNGEALDQSNILMASIKRNFSERYLFNLTPKKNTQLLIATPGWPKGMKPFSTVSWKVFVPPKMEARVMFTNLTKLKCSSGHSYITIQCIGTKKEQYIRREDEEAKSEITVPDSFYLNMSNCLPEKGQFSVVTKVTLQKSQMLTIIVSIVAVLVVIFLVVLVVVCVVIKKKKKNLHHQVSIYNPNGTSFLPGHNGFPRSRQDNESHVYESIEDSLVYSHLLRNGAMMGIYGELDTHQAFAGDTDSQKPHMTTQSGEGNAEEGIYEELLHEQKPELPQRPLNHMQPIADDDSGERDKSGERSEGEQSPALGPRLEPEGGELMS